MSSKFAALKEVKKQEAEQPAPPADVPVEVLEPSSREEAPAATRNRGRPRGKRSQNDYVQTSVYVRKQTHREVKLALLQSDDARDFSELVDELLVRWLNRRRRK